jgi:hypothetical protein
MVNYWKVGPCKFSRNSLVNIDSSGCNVLTFQSSPLEFALLLSECSVRRHQQKCNGQHKTLWSRSCLCRFKTCSISAMRPSSFCTSGPAMGAAIHSTAHPDFRSLSLASRDQRLLAIPQQGGAPPRTPTGPLTREGYNTLQHGRCIVMSCPVF